MKLQAISSKELSAALGVSAKCMQKRNAMIILDYVLLSMRDGRFMFTTSTTESQLTIPAPLTLTSGTFTAPVALPIGSILSFLGALPDCWTGHYHLLQPARHVPRPGLSQRHRQDGPLEPASSPDLAPG